MCCTSVAPCGERWELFKNTRGWVTKFSVEVPKIKIQRIKTIFCAYTVSGQGPVAGCCECGDEPSGSCATELVITGNTMHHHLTSPGATNGPCADG
jgi:hypothetical protein